MKLWIAATALMGLVLAAHAETAAAPGSCESRAVSKAGKPLHGAAKNRFMQKCEAEAKGGMKTSDCAAKAVGSNGKPLAGAAKASFIKQCEAGGK